MRLSWRRIRREQTRRRAPQSARGVFAEVDEDGHEAPREELQVLCVPREMLAGLCRGLCIARADDALEVRIRLGEQVAHRRAQTLLQRELVCAPQEYSSCALCTLYCVFVPNAP